MFAHNVETVPRIFKRIRPPAFRYQRSLDVITAARNFGLVTKSNLILGMGETNDEVRAALADLHEAGCDIVTITQYLRPLAAAPPGGPLGAPPRRIRRVVRLRRGPGFAGVLAGHWCDRPTERAGCTSRRRACARPFPEPYPQSYGEIT